MNHEIYQNKPWDIIILGNKVCLIKIRSRRRCVISHSSKSIWVIKLSFCQTDFPNGGSFWQKDSLITHILFELWLITILGLLWIFMRQTLDYNWACDGKKRLEAFSLQYRFLTIWSLLEQNLTRVRLELVIMASKLTKPHKIKRLFLLWSVSWNPHQRPQEV